MTRTLRVAILECDTPIDPVRARFGTYGDIFEKLLRDGLKDSAAEVALQCSKWNVVKNPVFPDLSDFDALLLTGSRGHDAFSDSPWVVSVTEYVRKVFQAQQKPLVGICFGHQILARALGARVEKSTAGWELSVDEISLSGVGKSLFGKHTMYLHQMHRDIVQDVPEECVNLGHSPRCAVQGLYIPKRVLTVQGHPEFNEYIMSRVVEMRHKMKIFDDDMFQDGMSRAGKPHDGSIVGAAICKFLLE